MRAGQPSQNEPVIAVELLRFMAALMVMACHYGIGFWRAPGLRPRLLLGRLGYTAPGEAWWQVGWLGVEIFFVISGMMIARSAVGVDRASFARRRMLRLAPAAWICGTITLAALALAMGPDRGLALSWLRSALFWPIGQQIDASYWTLGIELVFYAVVGATLGRAGSARRIEAAGIAIGLASATFWAGIMIAGARAAPLGFDRGFALLLLPHGCFFGLGVLIASADAAGWTGRRQVLAAVLGSAAALEIGAHTVESVNETGVALPLTVPLALFAGVIAVLIGATALQPMLGPAVSPAKARRLGLMTYPLYLVHQEAGAALVATLAGAGLPVGTALLIAAAAALLTAWAVATFAEPALRRHLAAVSLRRGLAPDRRPTAFPRAG